MIYYIKKQSRIEELTTLNPYEMKRKRLGRKVERSSWEIILVENPPHTAITRYSDFFIVRIGDLYSPYIPKNAKIVALKRYVSKYMSKLPKHEKKEGER
jgi:hypothetical protein